MLLGLCFLYAFEQSSFTPLFATEAVVQCRPHVATRFEAREHQEVSNTRSAAADGLPLAVEERPAVAEPPAGPAALDGPAEPQHPQHECQAT